MINLIYEIIHLTKWKPQFYKTQKIKMKEKSNFIIQLSC